MKFFTREEHTRALHLIEWGDERLGYIKFYSEWDEILHPGRYNWVSFTPLSLNIEYDKFDGKRLTVDVALLGVVLTFFQSIEPPELSMALADDYFSSKREPPE